MTQQQQPKSLSPLKRFAGLCGILAVVIVSGGLGFFLVNGTRQEAYPTEDVVPPIVLFIIGMVILFLGAAFYGLVLVTNCFTFDFTKPFLQPLRGKLWKSNLVTGLLLQTGGAFMIASQILPYATRAMSPGAAIPLSFFVPFIGLQFLFIWIQLWGPLIKSLIWKRLAAVGITQQQLAAGQFVGVSDPTRNSFKKMSMIEEDLGMLWFSPQRLVYRGDTRAFDFSARDIERIERKADAGSVSSYFGAVHVILHARQGDGTQTAIRLHVEGTWTLSATARGLNNLAKNLEDWHAAAASVGTAKTAAAVAAASR